MNEVSPLRVDFGIQITKYFMYVLVKLQVIEANRKISLYTEILRLHEVHIKLKYGLN